MRNSPFSSSMEKALEALSIETGAECSPAPLSYVWVDIQAVDEYFNEYFEARWSCGQYLSFALSDRAVEFCDTGLLSDGLPLLAIRFWQNFSTEADLRCHEVFFVEAHENTREEKIKCGSSASHDTGRVVWWYTPD